MSECLCLVDAACCDLQKMWGRDQGKWNALLHEQEEVSVRELAEKFAVSEMTIRRDFHLLEEQGIAQVHYGGATLQNRHQKVQDFAFRQDKLYRSKLCIARRAAAEIKEGDVLFLDASTTIALMLRFVSDRNLTVVTTSLAVMEAAYQNHRIKLYMAPGMYQELYGGPMDHATAEYVSRFHYDKAFFGASAVDAEFGASAAWEIEGVVKCCVSRNADRQYLLADHSKFGKKNLMKYGEIDAYEAIFTDEALDPQQRSAVQKNGGKLIFCS